MVYHYTTTDSFFSLLASYKAAADKDYLVFWASNALDQNDTEELHYSFDDLYKAILDFENDKNNKKKFISFRKLSDNLNWGIFENKSFYEVKDEINLHVNDRNYTPYTLSFSHNKDELLMWSIYANNGNGICLAFDENEFTSLKTEMRYISNSVRYNDISNFITDVIELVYDDYLKSYEKEEMIFLNIAYHEGKIYMKTLLEFISPFIKNKAFENEQEWRIVFLHNKKTKEFTRITRYLNLVHYVKVGIPVTALKNIIIGPCANHNKVVELLQREASACGIEKMTDKKFFIKSTVPYRKF